MAVAAGPLPPVVLFPNSSGMGGMEAHLLQLAHGLRRRGVEVAAICEPREDLEPLREGLAEAGAQVHALHSGNRSPAGLARRLGALVNTLRQYDGCIIHMHYGGYGGGELVQLAGRLAGARAVVRTEHVPPVSPITSKGRMLVHMRDRFLSKVICVSEQNRQEHLRDLGRDAKQCIVVHNGVDLERFSPNVGGTRVRQEFGFDPDAQLVGTIARLVEHRKGLNYFIDMIADVRRINPRVRFLLIGEGPLRDELEAQARALNVLDVLVFTGGRSDVPRLLAALDVFVMPSLYEGCQYSLLEAMAMARPIVSTPAGIAPVVIRDGETGLMVPFADARAMAVGVQRMLEDAQLRERLGAAGREVIVGEFSLDAMVDQILGVYQSAIS